MILSPIEQSIKRKIEAVGTPLKDWDINIYRGVLTGYNEAFIISSDKRKEILSNCQTEEEMKRTEELIRPIMEGNITIQIISLVLNFILASGLVGTILFFKPKKRKENAEAQSSELKNTEQIVNIQSQQIKQLDGRGETLEKKVDKLSIIIEHKDVELSENRHIIRQAFKCEYVDEPADCPVLTLKAEYDRKKNCNLKRRPRKPGSVRRRRSAKMANKLSRGYRNCNPGNIRISKNIYKGEIVPSQDTAFKQFQSMAYGYRAMFVLIHYYYTVLHLKTVRQIISRYAPPSENHTESYIRHVADAILRGPDSDIDINSKDEIVLMIAAMSKVENGVPANIDEVLESWSLYRQDRN